MKKWVTVGVLLFSQMVMAPAFADFLDIGYSRINYELFNFFNPGSEKGKYITEIYKYNVKLRTNEIPFERLPREFEDTINALHKFILENSVQSLAKNEKDPYDFFSGKNGVRNGRGFTFNRDELPRKIARLAFCFGTDPFVYASMLQQESKFSVHATSKSGASGLAQLTNSSITEINEQFGLLGPKYRPKDSVEFLNQAIACYYGPKKKWVNMWEDGTIPMGAKAYVGSKIGDGRILKNIDNIKQWLKRDPDRNLVYGMAYFKMLINRENKTYADAIKDYNVGQKHVYFKSVKNYYGNLVDDLVKAFRAKKGKFSFRPVALKYIEFPIENYKCTIPDDDSSWLLPAVTLGFYKEKEVDQILKDEWISKGFCSNSKSYQM
ncbi:MAG: transglycosylase SLT domain-containing protein [Bdellovibrionaceae bacterium]|nr:transglycosylase SLT domain-containing protein [Pseudobdellovibrionaceae bacterium]